MGGKRQHFVPRFLQSGFGSHRNGDEVFTWVYRKGAATFNTNVANVGVEGLFYTEGDDPYVDDLITEAESDFSKLVEDLRAANPGVIRDPTPLARFIAHLEIRTRHLRETFLRAGSFMVSGIADFMADESAFLDYLERTLQKDPSIMAKAASEEVAKHGWPEGVRDLLLDLAPKMMPVLMQSYVGPMLPQLAKVLRERMPQVLKDAAKSGHIKGLKRAIAPEAKVQRYQSLTYSVVETGGPRLILGDSILIFAIDGVRRYKTLLEKDDTLLGVYVPIGGTRVLVGAPQLIGSLPVSLYEAIARCSLEYFISDEASDTNEALKEAIGTDAALLTRAEMEAIITDVLTV